MRLVLIVVTVQLQMIHGMELDPNDYCAEIVIVEIPADWTCSDTYYTDSYCDGCGAY